MLFNNDFENNTNPDDCRSSLMEVTLNETSMTAYVNWSWEAPTSYWNYYAGSIVHLPNGDFIGDFGDPTHQFAQNELPDGSWSFDDTGAVFVEVNPAGHVVRTFTFPVGCYTYRVEAVTNMASIVFTSTSSATPTPTPVSLFTFPTFSNPPYVTSAPTPVNPTPAPASPLPIPVITPTPPVSQSSPSPSSIHVQTTTTKIVLEAMAGVLVLSVIFYPRRRISDSQNQSQEKERARG